MGGGIGAPASSSHSRGLPLSVKILIGVALGIALGMAVGTREVKIGGTALSAKTLGDVSLLVIKLLKALATPLILFAVLDAFVRTHIPGKQGLRLIGISLINACVAIAIGLTIANVMHGGDTLKARVADLAAKSHTAPPKAEGGKEGPTLDLIQNMSSYVPKSITEPLSENNIISMVLIAVLFGVALRRARRFAAGEMLQSVSTVEHGIAGIFAIFTQVVGIIIQAIPYAVFGVVASVVSRTGPGIFKELGFFLVTILIGFVLHAFVYYSFVLWAIARKSPREFFSQAFDAIVTAMSCGSSLATLPVTLRCLQENMKISPASTRLAACVGTNLNHDGIILYEAAATVFMAQAFGYDLTLGQQLVVAMASIMAGFGIAGVPEAGLITLPLVLTAAGLPPELVALVIPLVLPVDWIIGRGRATTNVISDMVVANLLERFRDPEDIAADKKAAEELAAKKAADAAAAEAAPMPGASSGAVGAR